MKVKNLTRHFQVTNTRLFYQGLPQCAASHMISVTKENGGNYTYWEQTGVLYPPVTYA